MNIKYGTITLEVILMLNNNFSLWGKGFNFLLDEYSCYKCKTKICSLCGLNLSDIQEIEPYNECEENSVNYCKNIAKMWLQGNFELKLTIYHYESCDHYACSDGQHRICTLAYLQKISAPICVDIMVEQYEGKCSACQYSSKDIRSFFYRIFRRDKSYPLIDTNNKLWILKDKK